MAFSHKNLTNRKMIGKFQSIDYYHFKWKLSRFARFSSIQKSYSMFVCWWANLTYVQFYSNQHLSLCQVKNYCSNVCFFKVTYFTVDIILLYLSKLFDKITLKSVLRYTSVKNWYCSQTGHRHFILNFGLEVEECVTDN